MRTWVCSAVLFDMDGTVIDSNAAVRRQWELWAARHNLPLAEVLKISHGRRTLETMQTVAPFLPQPQEVEEFIAAEAHDLSDVTAIDGAMELLQALPSDRWAIVTSSPLVVAEARLRHTGMPLPHVLVTADDVRRGKPDPEPWLTAAALLDVAAEECLVIEDANSGIAAARAAGMRVIGAGWATRERLDTSDLLASFRDLTVRVEEDRLILSSMKRASPEPRR